MRATSARNLPAPEIIAAGITADREAALEQFAPMAEDLKKLNRLTAETAAGLATWFPALLDCA